MKRLVATLVLLLFCLIASYMVGLELDKYINKPQALVVFVDEETGCHYLTFAPGHGISPRWDRHGKHICESISRKEMQ